MQSQQILKMSSSSPNADTQASAPLLNWSMASSITFCCSLAQTSTSLSLNSFTSFTFYRAMHFSAKRGIAIACRLSVRPSVSPSVCLSVCNVGEL